MQDAEAVKAAPAAIEEGLQVPQRRHKRRRLGQSANGCTRQRAEFPNHVWSYDFVSDQTEDGRTLQVFVGVDEFTRRSLALAVGRSFTSREVLATLATLVSRYGPPTFIRSDNGPEFIAAAVRRWLDGSQIGALFIAPGSPWENAYAESFNSRLRDEFLNGELFQSLPEAKFLLQDFQNGQNRERPHSSLGHKTPEEFHAEWMTQHGDDRVSINPGLS